MCMHYQVEPVRELLIGIDHFACVQYTYMLIILRQNDYGK